MECDLQRIFGELAGITPVSEDEKFIFTAEVLPLSPSHLATDRLHIKKGGHQYGYSYEVDALHFYAQKDTYRFLGLLVLSVIFHPEPGIVHVELAHPASEIKHLFIENSFLTLDELATGYYSRPYAFVYWPEGMSKHPFRSDISPRDLPCFALTNLNDFVMTEEHRRERDTVRSFGTDRGSALFAQLLLNASRPDDAPTEYVLEAEPGYRGVGVCSAEVSICLPGYDFWEDKHWLS